MTFQDQMKISPSNLEWIIRFEQQRQKEYGGNRTLTINKILEKWLETHE